MAIPYKTPQEVVSAAAATPAFSSAFRAAPPTVRRSGKTYRRDDARNVQQQVWYLAAAAMANPGQVAALASKGYDLDPDRTALDEAERAERAAYAKFTSAKGRVAGLHRELKRLEENQRTAEATRATCKDLDPFCQWHWNGQIQWWKDRQYDLRVGQGQWKDAGLAQAERALEEARSEWIGAKARVADERKRYNEQLRAARDEEERARQEQLAEERRRAENERRTREAEELRRREEDERRAAEERRKRAEEAAANQPSYEDTYSEEDYTDDEGVIFGDSEWLDHALAEDVYGDADVAEDLLADVGEPVAGEDLVPPSPWEFDQYYGCDACYCDGEPCEACGRGYDAAAEEQFFLDWTVVLTGIIAAILAIAPIILAQLSPPPTADDSSADTNPGAESIVKEVAERTGVQGLIDEHARKAGAAARPDLTLPAAILALAILAG